ncbi:hypothetical protein EYZ11_003838 [Aspergillus tanneri]|uniref:Rhodopsin domain-containing protein n=1 Tax=Aspergillus tanneri TaxID=1220188 RepID=A0A4S3JMF5_9EURO|nr:uncharacterized protein ATNIH1004_002929 [Aspergillus tanneri]KAA8650247.1 hypothetical protein ATNIH1004_002929 [Aspergillus tanneri]THC96683.1 hypothetical protein EYZ11_003838 [Aspergillus tanneri]
MAIPNDILVADAEGRIPAGVSLEYLAESRDPPAKVAIIFLICLAGLVMIVRLYARAFLVKKIGMDDILAVLTMLIYISFVVLSIILIDLGSGRHFGYIQYVLSMPTVRETEVLDFVAHVLYTTALFLCRLSGLAFYHRLAARSGRLHLAIKIAAVFLFAAFLPQFFLLIFHCRPVTGLWPYPWQEEPVAYNCLTWGLVYSVNSAVSLTCDILMFIIPAILIKNLHVSLKKKMKLSLVMFPGVLVIVISTIRVYLVAIGQWSDDGSWAYNPMMGIENAEIAGTLIALSVPALKPVFGNLFAHLTEYTTSSRHRTLSGRLKSQSNPGTGIASAVRDNKRLLSSWSKHGNDDYEMMQSETNVSSTSPAPRVDSGVTKGRRIKVTEEISIIRGDQ